MKIEQEPKFQPITIKLETREEVLSFMQVINNRDHAYPEASDMRDEMCAWFENWN